MFDDIDSIMEYNVGQPEYLRVCNRLIDARTAIDFDLLVDYMREQNRIYSKEHFLCAVCHSELVEMVESEEGYVSSRNLECPHGCI